MARERREALPLRESLLGAWAFFALNVNEDNVICFMIANGSVDGNRMHDMWSKSERA
jgi:hypothetical protein